MLFMRNPNLFKQGMHNKCFNKKEMLKWINYAIFHALVSYLLCFYAITGSASRWNAPVMSDGKPNGFWVAGHVVYTSTVLISNWTLVHQFHIHHLPGFALICLMWFANFFFLALESSWFEPTLFADVFRIFTPTFSQPITWLSLGMMMCQVSIFEMISEQRKFMRDERQREEFVRKSLSKYDLNEGGSRSAS